MVSYLVEYGWRSAYVAFKLPDGSNCREVITRLPVENPSYMHSFALTRNYLIFVEFPLIVHPIDFITKDKPFIKQFVWKPDRGTRFTIIKRDTGVVAGKVTAPPFFAFHHANAYEKGEEIIVDLIAYPDASIVGQMAKYGSMESSIADIDALNENIDTSLRRFKIDLTKQTIQPSTIYEGPLEFPRINDFANDGREYKYLYAVDPRLLSPQIDRLNLYKISVEEKLALQWSEIGCQPGEPVFVPAPTRSREDDGVVLSVVFDSKRGHSFLLVLDAVSFCEIGRAEVPHKMPLGLHGQFFFGNV
jgi:carotenoid cleavage dioxygenase-like enzyme